MFEGVRNWLPSLESLLRLIYPENCRQCDRAIHPLQINNPYQTGHHKKALKNTLFCSDCWEKVAPLAQPACSVCAAPFADLGDLSHTPDHLCDDCRNDPPAFSRAITPYPYEGALAKAVQLLKYKKQTRLAKNMAVLLLSELAQIGELVQIKVDWVTAIPLHPVRLRAREFNQSLLIANEVSRVLDWPLGVDLMCRVRDTQPQVGLSKKARKDNIHHVFSVRRPERISGQRILLIDDVYTTGATLKEGAKALIQSGAKEVIVAAPLRMVFRNQPDGLKESA